MEQPGQIVAHWPHESWQVAQGDLNWIPKPTLGAMKLFLMQKRQNRAR